MTVKLLLNTHFLPGRTFSLSEMSLCSRVKSGSTLGTCQAGTSQDPQIFVPLCPKNKGRSDV